MEKGVYNMCGAEGDTRSFDIPIETLAVAELALGMATTCGTIVP